MLPHFQTELWKKYIAWEKKNPLRTEDQSLITKRGMIFKTYCSVLDEAGCL